MGLPEAGVVRRVPGLRREEVAQLAAISTDYCTRLEQGRVSPSAPVLDALTRALQLDDDQRSYLSELAGKDPNRPHRRAADGPAVAAAGAGRPAVHAGIRPGPPDGHPGVEPRWPRPW